MKTYTAHQSRYSLCFASTLIAASLAACAGHNGLQLAPAPTTERACLAPNAVRWEVADGSRRTLAVWVRADVVTRDRWRIPARSRLTSALEEWNALKLPVQLVAAPSRAGADIRVEVIDRFPLDAMTPGSIIHGGLTHLEYTESGEIAGAQVFVAETTPRGIPFSSEDWYAILLHELGHALGLPHASRGLAVMAASPVVSSMTPVDAAMARTLYQGRRCGSAQTVTLGAGATDRQRQ